MLLPQHGKNSKLIIKHLQMQRIGEYCQLMENQLSYMIQWIQWYLKLIMIRIYHGLVCSSSRSSQFGTVRDGYRCGPVISPLMASSSPPPSFPSLSPFRSWTLVVDEARGQDRNFRLGPSPIQARKHLKINPPSTRLRTEFPGVNLTFGLFRGCFEDELYFGPS